MGSRDDGWRLAEGEDLAPGLSALRRLGGGSAYEAWLCFDEVTWSAVVVKVLRPSQVDDESSRRGLRREVLALRTVNHPVVVRSLRDGQDGERPHVVLEHVDGPRLSSLVRRHGRLQAQQYLPLAIDVASALHYLRHIGWTHLDIKPSNVIMGAPARLIDLSVARPEEDARRLRHPIGTDAWMAPEQADPTGEHAPSHAADVWGLGATLFHAVAGRRPFADGDPDAERRTPPLPAAGRGARAAARRRSGSGRRRAGGVPAARPGPAAAPARGRRRPGAGAGGAAARVPGRLPRPLSRLRGSAGSRPPGPSRSRCRRASCGGSRRRRRRRWSRGRSRSPTRGRATARGSAPGRG
ncbi:Protein kinase domain-containing protein [Nocardioides exalbidus]|uniref:non-specific serine/threonine protein kinase n=1 Tax=Nocardioides exalbidus TaxID=402596 RepID=A0A1H4W4V1_9ACTN|nr:Protein kinase domain-containing protein [Nocardioides exalbidus]